MLSENQKMDLNVYIKTNDKIKQNVYKKKSNLFGVQCHKVQHIIILILPNYHLFHFKTSGLVKFRTVTTLIF